MRESNVETGRPTKNHEWTMNAILAVALIVIRNIFCHQGEKNLEKSQKIRNFVVNKISISIADTIEWVLSMNKIFLKCVILILKIINMNH